MTRRQWVRRVVVTLLVWAAVYWLARWFYLRPDAFGLLAVAVLGAALWSAIADQRAWAIPEWSLDAVGRPARTTSDNRLSRVRHLVQEATGNDSTRRHGQADTLSTRRTLQRTLRDLAEERAHRNGDPAPLVERDHLLADYLYRDPPPSLSTTDLSRIIDRIEAL